MQVDLHESGKNGFIYIKNNGARHQALGVRVLGGLHTNASRPVSESLTAVYGAMARMAIKAFTYCCLYEMPSCCKWILAACVIYVVACQRRQQNNIRTAGPSLLFLWFVSRASPSWTLPEERCREPGPCFPAQWRRGRKACPSCTGQLTWVGRLETGLPLRQQTPLQPKTPRYSRVRQHDDHPPRRSLTSHSSNYLSARPSGSRP